MTSFRHLRHLTEYEQRLRDDSERGQIRSDHCSSLLVKGQVTAELDKCFRLYIKIEDKLPHPVEIYQSHISFASTQRTLKGSTCLFFFLSFSTADLIGQSLFSMFRSLVFIRQQNKIKTCRQNTDHNQNFKYCYLSRTSYQ